MNNPSLYTTFLFSAVDFSTVASILVTTAPLPSKASSCSQHEQYSPPMPRLFVLFFRDRPLQSSLMAQSLLCRLGWPQTCSDPPVPASQVPPCLPVPLSCYGPFSSHLDCGAHLSGEE